ncbi:MAG: sigma-B regulation protein RsbU (phosphoserine phosphatase) [Planctomycetota bacterium]|jgi:sigma-B regulation protein RsbU (phosphoserine phosphatase)
MISTEPTKNQPKSEILTMQCMEVWGGNSHADTHVEMGGLDAWVVSRPLKGATSGGDVHYLSSCATGRVARMLLADVSGHGQEVARISDQLCRLMRRFVNYIDQSRFVEDLNTSFHELEVESNFATALVLSWFGPNRELTVSNAGHPSPLIYNHKKKSWSYLAEPESKAGSSLRNVPFGVVHDVRYDEVRCHLEPGDQMLCFSDGLIETLGDGSGRVGQAKLLQLMNEQKVNDPSAIVHDLTNLVESRCDDDLTLMLLRPNEDCPWSCAINKLKAPWHIVRGVIKAFKDRARPVPWPEISIANLGGAMIDGLNRFRKSPKDL